MVQEGAKHLRETAERYEDCARVCTVCDIGLSNAPERPTFIRHDWRDGLWRRGTAARLERILDKSLNEVARAGKRRRLAHERSEDLLTWNVFSWLEDRSLLGHVVDLVLPVPGGAPRIFYWGANDRYELEWDLRSLLQAHFNEHPNRLSEPDVLLVNRSAIVAIEAKFGSPNTTDQKAPFDRYVGAASDWFRSPDEVRRAGYYELVRNWAIGGVLANRSDRAFALINLVREGQEMEIERALDVAMTPKGLFKRLTWEHLLQTVEPALVLHLRQETLNFQPAFPVLDRPGG